MLNIGIGQSADIDLDRALDEAVGQARTRLDGAAPAAGLLFVGDGLDQVRVLARVRAAFPDIPLVGCSAAGEASPALGFQDDSILLVLFASPDVRFAAAIGRSSSRDPARAAREAFRQLVEQTGAETPRLCFMFSDSLRGDPDVELEELTRRFGASVPIVGGAAASYPPGGETSIFFNGEALTDALVLLALTGPLEVSTAIETSWCPIGHEGRVTRAEGKTVYRIDDAPALDFYRRMLGADAHVFLGAPLAVLEADGGIKVRSPMTFDSEVRSIEVMGGVSEGDTVQLAFATVDDVREGAGEVIERTLGGFPAGQSPALVFFCSCAARKMFLAIDVRQEFEKLQERTGRGVPVVGFYGFGEIGAATAKAPSRFHNQAIVSVALG